MNAFTTIVKKIDVLPLAKHYMDQLGLAQLFQKYVQGSEKMDLAPAQVLCMMVLNIVDAARPLYRVEEWFGDYLDGVTETGIEASQYNDDRLGRCLDELFKADRASFMAEVTKQAIEVHGLETARIHNDTTSITFSGAYEEEEADAVKLKLGLNKDHRPDCKQVVFGINITEDGHVPLSYRLYDGNQADVSTHQPNWDGLRSLLEKEDFVYVADSKLCSLETLTTIAEHNGRFVTIVPRNFTEAAQFLERVAEGEQVTWQHTYKKPSARKKGKFITYRLHEGETLRGGYRILWVHSSTKQAKESGAREQRLQRAEAKLEQLVPKLNARRLKTREQIKRKVDAIIATDGNLLQVTIRAKKHIERVKATPGRPGKNTLYKKQTRITYHIDWKRNEDAIAKESRTDGLFPLVDNTEMEPLEVLHTYKNQPFLEKRFFTSKSVLDVMPVFLKKPSRIEAIIFLYFLALMLVSLIERNTRAEMEKKNIKALPILPTAKKTKAPTWSNIKYFFRSIHLSIIISDNKVVHHAVKGITSMHEQLLRLLAVPIEIYSNIRDRWWEFSLQ